MDTPLTCSENPEPLKIAGSAARNSSGVRCSRRGFSVVSEPDVPLPADDELARDWAKRFGMTQKALSRAFRRELRTTFGAWQRSARVKEAARRLAAGASVTHVAFDLGYASMSAFTTMFRRVTGSPPSKVRGSRR
jgi:transcriptional regulator GlxA family with amidase domain